MAIMHNPFARWPITNDWQGHMSYSLGGEDYPTPYGYAFEAPASGILRSSGGSGEFAAGWIGSAGRRSILSLDTPIRDAVAVVFQHQSAFGREGHYDEYDPNCGFTGASANGMDYGGDVHMHVHCLNAQGGRLPFTSYIGSAPAGGGTTPIEEENEMGTQVRIQESGGLGRTLFISPTIVTHVVHDDVVAVNNYIGVPGGVDKLQVSLDDARRLIEVRGFDWGKVNALRPGEGVLLNGTVVNAGAAVWS